ncbi:alpha/beta hydrolase [Rhodococcus artemisiae]|uniref:Alpha/beta hydrolase n=1 Tax=Rhodococcus artemisiae TaxID=714159 RepID=A0ABU7LCI6_9NOCA|nr:alpha/beta hydrolase [Rhodococcus artemisiae]MEE2059270.1 alpha/beta hydrolase [Rhodococcus artemisiae]
MGIADFVSKAAHNAWSLFVADGVAEPHRTPSVVVGDGPHRTLRRFGPEDAGDPVLLVTPLAASPTCFDLMPEQSLAAYLVGLGRSVFLIEYGEMTDDDRDLGLEYWIDDVLPEAIHRVAELSGGRKVDIVAWSIAGSLTLLTSAAHPELPVRSITTFGTPIDYEKIPLMVLPRLAGRYLAEPAIDVADHLFGGIPAPVVRIAYRITAIEREVRRPWFVAANIADREKLARMERVDRFQNEIEGYAGRVFRQLAVQVTVGNELTTGRLQLGGRVVELADVDVPVLALGGTDDVLAPIPSVEPVTSVLTGAPRVRCVRVPGTHLGILAGTTAPATSWVELTAFLDNPLGEGPDGAGPVPAAAGESESTASETRAH